MRDAKDVNEKDLREAVGAINGTKFLENKIEVKGATVEDMMKDLCAAVESLEEDQANKLPEKAINMYNDLIEDEVEEAVEEESVDEEVIEEETVKETEEEEVVEEIPEEEVVEEVVEDVVEETVEKKKEKKKEKKVTEPVVAKASTKEEVKTNKNAPKQSASNFLMKYLCDNPDATEEGVQGALEKAGFRRLAEITVHAWIKDMKNITVYLKEIGKLK
ncbi:unnamed protein product [marine sediment metagenome]|uniref:Uncharacterized protein n=1 Tax=marine sediment metagenome TaxID=412755 RepID=X0UAX9_9ZZZZ